LASSAWPGLAWLHPSILLGPVRKEKGQCGPEQNNTAACLCWHKSLAFSSQPYSPILFLLSPQHTHICTHTLHASTGMWFQARAHSCVVFIFAAYIHVSQLPLSAQPYSVPATCYAGCLMPITQAGNTTMPPPCPAGQRPQPRATTLVSGTLAADWPRFSICWAKLWNSFSLCPGGKMKLVMDHLVCPLALDLGS
jgi:hypothetical protein